MEICCTLIVCSQVRAVQRPDASEMDINSLAVMGEQGLIISLFRGPNTKIPQHTLGFQNPRVSKH